MTARNIKKVYTAVHTPTEPVRFGVDFTNIRGLHANLSAVHHHLETARPALLFLTETQILRPADMSYLQYPGYSLEESFLARAGVCLYIRADICCRRLRCMEDSSFSVLWVHVDLGTQSRIYVCLYRSHRSDFETTQLFEYLGRATDKAQTRFPTAEFVFLGDFNAHHVQWLGSLRTDHAGKTAHDFALAHGLTQLVSQNTRVPDVVGHAPSMLDLLLTSHPTGYLVSSQAPLGGSDHCLVVTSVPRAPPPQREVVERQVWHYSSADWDGLREYLASIPWGQRCFRDDNLSTSAVAIADEILLGMEYYIPSSRVVSRSNGRPWYNSDCAAAIAAKNAAYRNWVRGHGKSDPNISSLKAAFNNASKVCKRVFARAESQRISRIGQELIARPAGSRSFWQLAKSVETNFCRPSLPPLRYPDGSLAYAAKEKANYLAKLFAANSQLDEGSAQPPTLPECGSKMPEIRIRQCDVRAALQSLDVRKASGPDGIPAIVLKKCAPELSPVLTRLYRLSYSSGIVPETWRVANVQPVPKKGDRSDPSNYRPIAVTSVLCKVLEKIINSQLIRYLEDHSILNDRQYGFRPKRSAGDLLTYVTHVWGEAMDKHGESLAVSLDISKAFDRVWHKALLSKLPAYGLPDRLCDWISGFLHERRIRVLIDGHASEFMSVNAGVPQGSVLSPTLFLLHINDMLSLGNIHCYADDSTVHERYLSPRVVARSQAEELRRSMVADLDSTLNSISIWGAQNLVQFNASKTQACVLTGKKSLFSLSPSLQGVALSLQPSLSILGIKIRSDLNHRDYIESITKTASKKLGILNKVRRFFTPKHRLLLYKAQIRACVEYCSHLWDGSARYLLDALNVLQRRAVRIVDDHKVTSQLESLQHRRDVASLSVFYRLFHGECSEELFNLIPPSPFRTRTTRTGQNMHPYTVDCIPTRTKKFGDSYICRTIKMWNALPASVFPPSYNIESFKRSVNKQINKPA